MAIILELIDESIIRQTWTGHITGEDLLKAADDQTILLKQHHFEHFITIIDASEATGIEINMRVILSVTELESRELAIYIITPMAIGSVLVKIVAKLVPNKEIRICSSVQEANELAIVKLQKAKTSDT